MFCGKSLPHAGQGSKALPPGDYPKCGIINPNPFKAANNVWTPVPEIFHPVVMRSTTAVALTTVCRGRPFDTTNDVTTLEEYPGIVDPSTGILWQYLPFAGRWKLHHNAGSSVVFVMLDAYAPDVVPHFAGIRILGGSVSLSPVSGGSILMAAPTFATVGVASATAVAANANRKFIHLQNTHGSNVIALGFDGNAAVLGSGVQLGPNREWRSMQSPAEAPTVGAITAIASGAATNLAIQEGS